MRPKILSSSSKRTNSELNYKNHTTTTHLFSFQISVLSTYHLKPVKYFHFFLYIMLKLSKVSTYNRDWSLNYAFFSSIPVWGNPSVFGRKQQKRTHHKNPASCVYEDSWYSVLYLSRYIIQNKEISKRTGNYWCFKVSKKRKEQNICKWPALWTVEI